MKYQIILFFVWVSCFSITSSYQQYQEYGNEYQPHSDGPIHRNFASNAPVHPVQFQSVRHALPSHASHYTSHPQPRYHQRETLVLNDPKIHENIAENSAPIQATSRHVEKPPEYIPQPYQELPRPYPVDETLEFHVPPVEHVNRPDYPQHVAKPWVSQNTYQPTVLQESYHQPHILQESYDLLRVQQEPYRQPIVYSRPQPSVYQQPPPLQPTQPQHPQIQRTYYNPQPLNEVSAAQAQVQAYAISESNAADILASKPKVKDNLELTLFQHYQHDNLGNSGHHKSSDVKLEENDIKTTSKKHHNTNHDNKQFPPQQFDNLDNQNKKLHFPQENIHIIDPKTIPEVTKHETIPPKNNDNEIFYHPRFSFLNHKENPHEIKTFAIEIKPTISHQYRDPIGKHHPNAKHSDNILVSEIQKPVVPSTSLDKTDNNHKVDPQYSKDKEEKGLTLYDHNLPVHEQRNKTQHESQLNVDKIHDNNNNKSTNHYPQIPTHPKPTDQIIKDNPVGISVDTSSQDNNTPKDSLDDVTPTILYSDTIDDTKAPINASSDSYYDKPQKELYSDLQTQPEVAKPSTEIYNGNGMTNTMVATEKDTEKITLSEIDVTKINKVDNKQQTINENVPDKDNNQQKPESEPRSTNPKDIEKQSSLEGSSLNADSLTDDGTSTEGDDNSQNDDCTSGETDPNNNADDEDAAESHFGTNAVLLSSIDLWEKLVEKQPDLELQAYDVVTLSPIVEKTSRLFAFPNHTTVEEIVEITWKCKDDVLPLEIKKTTIINFSQNHSDADKHQTKCD